MCHRRHQSFPLCNDIAKSCKLRMELRNKEVGRKVVRILVTKLDSSIWKDMWNGRCENGKKKRLQEQKKIDLGSYPCIWNMKKYERDVEPTTARS